MFLLLPVTHELTSGQGQGNQKDERCIIYNHSLQKQVSSTRIRAKENAIYLAIPDEKKKKPTKMLKDLEGLKRSFQSVLPTPIELSW